ncbi:hypothetical protein Poly51_22800 [Rubripirellula tenax]|uniref:Uncharacterized protein n=1 Tax=Rubripirellula tenax TaxID=2528015 RepID=A0A5C6FFH2_9BACT|nr:hypothetical protein [Rubripirellula tenax]TWU59492.1 hypothetical protein Poly51_22800 [Rubripirellula tenax]
MSDDGESVDHAVPAKDTLQFRLSSIFVVTLVATILAAFLSARGHDMMLAGVVTTIASAAFALALGRLRPPRIDRVFWGVVVAAMMQVVASEVTLLDRQAGVYAWPIVAGFAAVVAAGRSPLYRRMLIAALTAAILILPYVIYFCGRPEAVVPYVICAAIGGALLTFMIDAVRWLEARFRVPQPLVGISLVLAAMAFATVAQRVIPGW